MPFLCLAQMEGEPGSNSSFPHRDIELFTPRPIKFIKVVRLYPSLLPARLGKCKVMSLGELYLIPLLFH